MSFKNAEIIIFEKLETWWAITIENIPNALVAFLVFSLFWFFSKILYNLSARLFKRTHLNQSLENLLAKIIQLSCILLGFVLALGILKLDKAVFSLMAGVGVVGLALGFAFRDLASNFISGLMLATSAPFRAGDVIQLGDLQGTVSQIRLRDTVLRNFDGQDILIPNKQFMTSQIQNYHSSGLRKISFDIGVGYEDDITNVKHRLKERIEALEGIDKSKGASIHCNSFGDSTINLNIGCWVPYPNSHYQEIKDRVMIATQQASNSGLFSMPYPTRTFRTNEPSTSDRPEIL